MATKGKFRVISFFRFLKIKNKKETKKSFDNFLKDMSIRGTILVSSEGINGSLSGTKKDLESTLKFIRKLLMIRELNLKINEIYLLIDLKLELKKKLLL